MDIDVTYYDEDDQEHTFELDVHYFDNGERDPQRQDFEFWVYSAKCDDRVVPAKDVERLMDRSIVFHDNVMEAAAKEAKNEAQRAVDWDC